VTGRALIELPEWKKKIQGAPLGFRKRVGDVYLRGKI
jgi:hypothetical protein